MKNVFKNNRYILSALLGSAVLATSSAPAFALSLNKMVNTTTSKASNAVTTVSNLTLSQIIGKANTDISNRLTKLQNLTSVVNTTTNKLTPSDRAYLAAEISGETTGLTNLKVKIDADVSVSVAKTDYSNVFLQYRVYALVSPKVTMIKAADDQQATQTKLTAMATTLQTRITDENKAGKNTAQVQAWLNSMQTNTTNAQAISSNIESTVLTLQPSQYDANHALLDGDFQQLKQAQSDNQTAYTDAKNIVSALASM